jgi:hypothetical protein
MRPDGSMQFGVILSFIRQILAAERTRRIFHEGAHVLLIDGLLGGLLIRVQLPLTLGDMEHIVRQIRRQGVSSSRDQQGDTDVVPAIAA